METLTTEILVVGGGTGGTAAAIQAARRGAQVILVSEFPWLGGMLTSAGVSAPDGNELAAFQTGIWGEFLRQLRQRQPEGLDHAWVSFFTYEPGVGAAIFEDWARWHRGVSSKPLSNLRWISGQSPREVLKQGNTIRGVRFESITVEAQITLDATELGDLLALGEVPHRWGWEWRSQFQEPSAPEQPNELSDRYPVQAPTWVVVMQDYGEGNEAPEIPPPPIDTPEQFHGAWENYGPESFLNYGRLPGNRFMINWPQRGNDYGVDLNRLIESPTARLNFFQEARWHSQSFARFIQTQLGKRYGLAEETFPQLENSLGGGAYALHPYFRESRRMKGLTTVREQDILPVPQGQVAALPINAAREVEAIAIGNYVNDHHYPDLSLPLKPKALHWGGRWTGTPFALPYSCLVPETVAGLLVCEKNISVSHMANGATRLQPVVLGLGQAAGMAAALCVEQRCQPAELSVRSLQHALLSDPIAPAAVVPLFDVPPVHPDWQQWQQHYLTHPENYPTDGNSLVNSVPKVLSSANLNLQEFLGWFEPSQKTASQNQSIQDYAFRIITPTELNETAVALVTLSASVDLHLRKLKKPQKLRIQGYFNRSGQWLLAETVTTLTELS